MSDPTDSRPSGRYPANDGDDAALGDRARRVFAERRRRAEIPGTADLFGEPAWDILLQLFIAACEGRRISIAAACSDAGVPESTALRWVTVLEKRGMITRDAEAPRGSIRLTMDAYAGLAEYFSQA